MIQFFFLVDFNLNLSSTQLNFI